MATLGKLTDGTQSSASSADKTAVSSFTASASGALSAGHARIWLSGSGSTNTKVVVYANSAGAPAAKLAESDVVVLTATTEAVVNYTFSGANQAAITNGTTYWVGVAWEDPGTPSVNISRDATASARQENTSYAPNPFGTPTAQSGPIDVYVDTVLVSTKTGGSASAGAMSGAKVVTSATTRTKTGGFAGTGAMSGARATTSATTYTKTGGSASSAGALSGPKTVDNPSVIVTKAGGWAATGAASGSRVRDLAPKAGGFASSAGAMSGAKVVVRQKVGGAVGRSAMAGTRGVDIPKTGGASSAGAMSGARRRTLPFSGGAVASGGMSGAKVVTSAVVVTKAGGCVGRSAVSGRRALSQPVVRTKRGGVAPRGALSGARATTHATTYTKTGGSAATGAASVLRRRRFPRVGGFVAVGAISGPSEVVSAAVRTKTGGSVGRSALGGVKTVPHPRTLSVSAARVSRSVNAVRPAVANVQPRPVVLD